MGYFCRDFRDKTIEGSEKLWLFTSGCLELLEFRVPFTDDTKEKLGAIHVAARFYGGPRAQAGQ